MQEASQYCANTHIHTPIKQPSGTICGSLFCPKTLNMHTLEESGIKPPNFWWQTTGSTSWATLSHSLHRWAHACTHLLPTLWITTAARLWGTGSFQRNNRTKTPALASSRLPFLLLICALSSRGGEGGAEHVRSDRVVSALSSPVAALVLPLAIQLIHVQEIYRFYVFNSGPILRWLHAVKGSDSLCWVYMSERLISWSCIEGTEGFVLLSRTEVVIMCYVWTEQFVRNKVIQWKMELLSKQRQ